MAVEAAYAVKATRRGFYLGMAIALTAIVFTGFAPTFFLRGILSLPPGSPPLSTLIFVHGVVASLWMVLFVTQAMLVAAARTRLHRRLGIAGVALTAAMAAVGVVATLDAFHRGVALPGWDPRAWWLGNTLPGALMFAGFAAAALAFRRRAETHKRLMLFAAVTLASPALARIAIYYIDLSLVGVIGLGGTTLLAASPVAHDWLTRGRAHPASVCGLLVMIAVPPAAKLLAETPPALAFADLFAR